jgi:hypothetical protein
MNCVLAPSFIFILLYGAINLVALSSCCQNASGAIVVPALIGGIGQDDASQTACLAQLRLGIMLYAGVRQCTNAG